MRAERDCVFGVLNRVFGVLMGFLGQPEEAREQESRDEGPKDKIETITHKIAGAYKPIPKP